MKHTKTAIGATSAGLIVGAITGRVTVDENAIVRDHANQIAQIASEVLPPEPQPRSAPAQAQGIYIPSSSSGTPDPCPCDAPTYTAHTHAWACPEHANATLCPVGMDPPFMDGFICREDCKIWHSRVVAGTGGYTREFITYDNIW